MEYKFKGTPGPWRVVPGVDPEDRLGIDGPVKTIIVWGDINDDSDQCGVYGDNNIEAGANAKLIAAAPDLLQACIEFIKKVESGRARSTHSYEQMLAAVNKALK